MISLLSLFVFLSSAVASYDSEKINQESLDSMQKIEKSCGFKVLDDRSDFSRFEDVVYLYKNDPYFEMACRIVSDWIADKCKASEANKTELKKLKKLVFRRGSLGKRSLQRPTESELYVYIDTYNSGYPMDLQDFLKQEIPKVLVLPKDTKDEGPKKSKAEIMADEIKAKMAADRQAREEARKKDQVAQQASADKQKAHSQEVSAWFQAETKKIMNSNDPPEEKTRKMNELSKQFQDKLNEK